MSKTFIIRGPEKNRTPFLKGILVRSLVSIDIPFDDAYDLSQAIRDDLKNTVEITSDELEKLIAAVLARRFGKLTEAKYLGRKQAKSSIIVHTPTHSSPFSVGILSHSLEACSISPKLAITGASKVLASIRKTGHKEIDHKSLRKLIYRCLREHCSEKAANKYLSWRHFQNSDIPLIILIGGVAGTGKSTIAAELAYRLDISRNLPTDMMRDVIRQYMASQISPTMQYSSFEAWRGLTPLSQVALDDSEDKVITGFLDQLASMKPAINTTIERAFNEREHLILEGVHVVPSEIDICPEDKSMCVQFMLAILDKQTLKKRIRKQNKYKLSQLEAYIDNIWQLQSWLLEQSEIADVNIIANLDAEDIVREILEITSQVIMNKFPPHVNVID